MKDFPTVKIPVPSYVKAPEQGEPGLLHEGDCLCDFGVCRARTPVASLAWFNVEVGPTVASSVCCCFLSS